MKKSILFSVLVVGATLLQAQSITVHQTCGQNGQVVKAIPPEAVQAVDLGLSVKWANMNVGATNPEGYGNYYAWGETVTKATYDWSTYLNQKDDAAYVNWGGSWRMPTKAEWQELIYNCTWRLTTQNGINGYKVTSNKAGYTDKFIFLPAAGRRYGSGNSSVGSYGSYWSSSLYENDSRSAWYLAFGSGGGCDLVVFERCYGHSVRPVLPQTSISYSSSTNDTIRIYSNGCDDYQTFIGSHGGQLTMSANSDQWSHFVRWQDGNTDNPRTITTNGNADYTAYFAAASGTCGAQGDNLTWELTCDGMLTISGTGTMADYDSENSVPWYSKSITSVVINNSVTSIGNYAFYNCTGLTSVTIPNSVTSIGASAFFGCSGLTSVNITDIAAWCNIAFSSYNSNPLYYAKHLYVNNVEVTNLVIPEGVTSIGNSAFYGCSSLTSVTIPNSVTSIGNYAFWYCSGLTSVTIPNSVTSIGSYAFRDCSSLTPVTIPNSVTSIGNSAFYGCSSLTSVTIPNSVTSIGDFAFYGCRGLTSVTIPNSVTSIGQSAFASCRGLTSPVYNAHVFAYMPTSYSGAYTIPDGIESIAGGAFERCTGLTSVTIPNSVTSIGMEAFYNCTGLTSVTIPNSVTSIGNEAFYYCTGLTSVTIPNSVTSIGNSAFYGCSSLTSVTCLATTPPMMGDNVFYNVNKSIPLYVPAGSVSAYKSAKQWKNFKNILPISAQETETTSVQAEPTDNSVSVSWPQVSGAASYELVIKDKDGNVVCTLIFDAEGKLISIAYKAPSRDGAPQHTQTAGFTFTITGLEAGTEYNLTITAKNASGQEIDKKNASFHTNWPNGIEDIHVDSDKPVKVLMDGQIYILRGEHIYDTEGKMVK